MTNNLKEELIKQARLELARRDFFEYCKLTAPDFYKDDRLFLKDMCSQLQDFYESDDRFIVINLPPRHRQVQDGKQISRMDIREKHIRKDNDRLIQ